jgi:predicted ester cyclase
MASIVEVAEKFFTACEAGKGWDACKAFCRPDATFSSQAGAVADLRTLQQYAEWMKGLLVILPDGRYELKSFATDDRRNNVCVYAVFTGTHTGPNGPCAPTGKTLRQSDYVYVMEFDGDRIRHVTKIWPDTWALKQLGWA